MKRKYLRPSPRKYSNGASQFSSFTELSLSAHTYSTLEGFQFQNPAKWVHFRSKFYPFRLIQFLSPKLLFQALPLSDRRRASLPPALSRNPESLIEFSSRTELHVGTSRSKTHGTRSERPKIERKTRAHLFRLLSSLTCTQGYTIRTLFLFVP